MNVCWVKMCTCVLVTRCVSIEQAGSTVLVRRDTKATTIPWTRQHLARMLTNVTRTLTHVMRRHSVSTLWEATAVTVVREHINNVLQVNRKYNFIIQPNTLGISEYLDCVLDGKDYLDGTSWIDGCNECHCDAGRVSCSQLSCDCSVPGSDRGCCPECYDKRTCLHQDIPGLKYKSGEKWAYQCMECECLVSSSCMCLAPLSKYLSHSKGPSLPNSLQIVAW